MKMKTDVKYAILIANRKKKCDALYDKEVEKLEKKKRSYIRKKEEQYKRMMENELRELEGKPKKPLKTPWPKIKPLQFAMEIAQENARLRDSDEDGNGYCISCDKWCTWWEHAGGHRYSRKFQTCCLEKENINLQCHTCNFITWPGWNHEKKIQVNMHYDENLNKKFWEWTSAKLAKKVSDYFQGKGGKYDLERVIPKLIKENEKLWAKKNFYSPKRKWWNVWTRYLNRA